MSVLDAFRLDGKVAVVTGGGRGIGAAVVVALREAGAEVVIASSTGATRSGSHGAASRHSC